MRETLDQLGEPVGALFFFENHGFGHDEPPGACGK
jgi:hypothetical protein